MMETIYIIMFSLTLITLGTQQNSPPEGFKFNCGRDICVFPIQFCDTSVSYCKYCNEDVCRMKGDEIPMQCKTKCAELNGHSQRVESQELAKTTANGEGNWKAIAIVFICLSVVLVTLAIIMAVTWSCLKMRKQNEYNNVATDEENLQDKDNSTTSPSTVSSQHLTEHTECKNDVGKHVPDTDPTVLPTAPPIPAGSSTDPGDETTEVSSTTEGHRSNNSSLRNIHAQPEDNKGHSDSFASAEILPKTMTSTQESDSMDTKKKIEQPSDKEIPDKHVNGYQILSDTGIMKQANSNDSGFKGDETLTKTFQDNRVLDITPQTA